MVETAKRVANVLGVDEQLNTIASDLWSADYGANAYDVVWLGNITHFFSIKDMLRLFRKSYDALKKNGIIVVNSMVRRDREPSVLWISLWL